MKTRARNELPTIWEVPDALWEKIIEPILTEFDPPSKRGRPRADSRRCLNGIIYRARTGCQWNHLPQEFGDDATVHRTLKRWEEKQIFDKIWALLIYHCEDLSAVHWEWQAADGCLNKAKFIGKKGAKAERVPKPRKAKVSDQIPVIVEKWESNSLSLSREMAVQLLPVSQGQI
jgi:transposase